MKKGMLIFLLLCALTIPVSAKGISELRNALPSGARNMIDGEDLQTGADLTSGISKIIKTGKTKIRSIFYKRLRSCILILMVVLLCSMVGGFSQGLDEKRKFWNLMPMAGAASIALISAGAWMH